MFGITGFLVEGFLVDADGGGAFAGVTVADSTLGAGAVTLGVLVDFGPGKSIVPCLLAPFDRALALACFAFFAFGKNVGRPGSSASWSLAAA